MKKCNIIKFCVMVFSLMSLFMLPCISFATSFSDIRHGFEENSIRGDFDDVGLGRDFGYGRFQDWREQTIHLHRNHHGHAGSPSRPTPTPVPEAVWLLGSGLVGLIGIKRKVHK